MISRRLAGVWVLVLASGLRGQSQQEVDEQYHDVVAQMKSPGAVGVLVTEIAPDSPALTAGLRAGDIITQYDREPLTTLAQLRERVAERYAGHALAPGERKSTVAMTVRRVKAEKPVVLEVPTEPLAIRAIEVVAGVPAAMNPPGSARGAFTMHWAELLAGQGTKMDAEGNVVPGRSYFRVETESGTTLLAWQEVTISAGPNDVVVVKVQINRVTNSEMSSTLSGTDRLAMVLRTGDFQNAPAFLLESLELVSETVDGGRSTASLARSGGKLSGGRSGTAPDGSAAAVKFDQPLNTSALPAAAVPVLAAAMPLEKDAAISLALLSTFDAAARPGYVLVTRGQQASKEFRVDLMHCGAVAESYFLSGDRALLRIESHAGTNFTTRRVNSENDARSMIFTKPPTDVLPPPGRP